MNSFLTYLTGRLIAAVITLLGVIAVLVLTFQVLPGDQARVIAGMRASPAQVQKIRHSMGLDQPVAVQYCRYLGRVVHGDLGTSRRTGQNGIYRLVEGRGGKECVSTCRTRWWQ